jgi:guanine nucleotide-exchange factor
MGIARPSAFDVEVGHSSSGESGCGVAGRPARIFTLQKLVEVGGLNIQRIRVIWARVWPLVAAHLVEAGCHPSEPIAAYTVDALRQLSHTLLERATAGGAEKNDHLVETTLKEALKPFVALLARARVVRPTCQVPPRILCDPSLRPYAVHVHMCT